MALEIKYVNANNAVIHNENLVTGILAKISLGTGIWAKFRLGTGIWYPPSRPSWNIRRNVSLQFTGIFYLHLHSNSSLAKTWLSIRNRISPGLKVFHITLYLCSECANERASISKAVLEIEANAVIYIHTYVHTSATTTETCFGLATNFKEHCRNHQSSFRRPNWRNEMEL